MLFDFTIFDPGAGGISGWCRGIIEIYAKLRFEYPILFKSIWGIDINTIHFERQMSKCQRWILGGIRRLGPRRGFDPLAGILWIVGLIMGMGCTGACHWQVSPFTLDLCLMYSSLSGTWSGFSIYILYFLCVFSRQLWCSMSRRRLRPYWHSNILEESSQLINTGLGSSHKYRRTSTSHSCPHYQHMRGSGAAAEGNKWDIWQSESHSNISLSRPGTLAHSCQEVHW